MNETNMQETEWKVYRVNDVDWFVAKSAEEALAAALDMYDGDTDMIEDARELTLEEMQSHTFWDDPYNRDESGKRTFAEELARRIANGIAKPEQFATSEL